MVKYTPAEATDNDVFLTGTSPLINRLLLEGGVVKSDSQSFIAETK